MPRPSLQKPIRRLCAAGGERHSLRLYLENPSYGFTGILDNTASLTSFSVDRRRISGAIERSHHRVARLRPKRRCGVVIEIAANAHDTPFAAAASSLKEKPAAGAE